MLSGNEESLEKYYESERRISILAGEAFIRVLGSLDLRCRWLRGFG